MVAEGRGSAINTANFLGLIAVSRTARYTYKTGSLGIVKPSWAVDQKPRHLCEREKRCKISGHFFEIDGS